MSVQLTRDEVREAYKSFFALKKKGFTQHEAPGFRRKGQLWPLKYVQSGFKVGHRSGRRGKAGFFSHITPS